MKLLLKVAWENGTDAICDQINTTLNKPVRRDRDSNEYKRSKEMLFIHDIIVLFKALTEKEILGYFKTVNHTISKKDVSRGLFCLVKLDLIQSAEKGHETFFTTVDKLGKRYITLPAIADTARLSVSLAIYYSHSSHLARRDAIGSVV